MYVCVHGVVVVVGGLFRIAVTPIFGAGLMSKSRVKKTPELRSSLG